MQHPIIKNIKTHMFTEMAKCHEMKVKPFIFTQRVNLIILNKFLDIYYNDQPTKKQIFIHYPIYELSELLYSIYKNECISRSR